MESHTAKHMHFTDLNFLCVIYDIFLLWRYKPLYGGSLEHDLR